MQNNSTFAIAVVLGAAAALTGCTETIPSSDIKTSGIAATIEATAPSASESTVHVTLRAGGDESNTYVDLGGGDRIFTTLAGERKEMSSTSTGEYEAEFSEGAGDTTVTVSLEREDGDNAANSTGTLPEPFVVDEVTASVSRADDLVISWSPASDEEMDIDLDGTCIFNEDITVASGATSATIPGGSLDSTGQMDMPQTCDLTVKLTRSRAGSADRALDQESSFVLQQVRSIKVTSAP
jgi:hypothetical protein